VTSSGGSGAALGPALTEGDLDRLLAGAGPGHVFQPIVDLARATVVGYESLARFDHPVRSPLAWFDLARRHGRLAELEALSLRSAVAARSALPRNTFLTVNLSPAALDSPLVRAVWDDFPSLGGVVLELTEQDPVDSYAAIEPLLDRLRGAGALLAIDDAGAGYAGLQHMLSLRPDIIKLDRGLVEELDANEAKRTMVEMIGTLAGRLDAWLLAEGVERAEELDVLIRLGVPLAQGYYLGRPGADLDPLDTTVAARILSQHRLTAQGGLRALLELVPTAYDREEAAAAFADDHVDLVVLLDRHASPTAVMDADGLVHAVRDVALRVNVDTDLVEVVRRALVRPARHRFAPLVCTDNAGRHLGVVRMERLVEQLCRDAEEA
jgi:EAL domain-containing protein (putative c-di-GMP-specific phosphodiesterase class I)